MKKKADEKKRRLTRRDFIKASTAVSLAAFMPGAKDVFAAGSDKLRVGLIGCGGRGTGAAWDCATSSPNVEIYALGDLFRDRLDEALEKLTNGDPEGGMIDRIGKPLPAEKLNITLERCFVGFDAYKKVLATEVDVVILATPPHFRPIQLKAAIEAGKHVFVEKPVAIDPVGVRSVIESSELAAKKNLAIVAGTHRRHYESCLEIMKRIHRGDIGEILAGQCYWMGGLVRGYWRYYERKKGMSDMEWQMRNWQYFAWLSGDHIVEQHIHNLDVMNWALQTHPVKAIGMGGREVRKGPTYGNIYDHFAVEFEYLKGVRVSSMCRQMAGCSNRVSQQVMGTKGLAAVTNYGANGFVEGQNPYKYEGPAPNPFIKEHADMIASIRAGKSLNEGISVAESTLTGIMGRMSTYTGRELSWNWVMKSSKLDYSLDKYEFGGLPMQPVAVPGKMALV